MARASSVPRNEQKPTAAPACRFCGARLRDTFVNLGRSPLANSYLTEAQLARPESFYPLHAFVCRQCLLVQVEELERPEQIFRHYAYFSSYSDTWLRHCEVEMDEPDSKGNTECG